MNPLAGDVGGTKTNLAIYQMDRGPSYPLAEETFPSDEYPDLESILGEFLRKRKRAARVYLLVDGKRKNAEISDLLHIKPPHVTKELKDLESRGLIEQKKWGIYAKSAIESVLRLSVKLLKIPELKEPKQ